MTNDTKSQVSPVKKVIRSEHVFFQIKPFKDNELGVNHWNTVISNLISLKTNKITFLISGNSHSIKLFVVIPKSFKNYFQNTFYSNFPTSDLQQIDPFVLPINRDFIRFSED
jgi:hypothetical protein